MDLQWLVAGKPDPIVSLSQKVLFCQQAADSSLRILYPCKCRYCIHPGGHALNPEDSATRSTGFSILGRDYE